MTALFRKGDIATIDVIVTSSFNETQVCVKPVDGYQDVYLKPHELTMRRPKFEVGDYVTWSTHDGADSWTGRILSIANDHLWVQLDDGSFSTVWAGKAMRVDSTAVDPGPVEPPPAPLDGKVGSEEEA